MVVLVRTVEAMALLVCEWKLWYFVSVPVEMVVFLQHCHNLTKIYDLVTYKAKNRNHNVKKSDFFLFRKIPVHRKFFRKFLKFRKKLCLNEKMLVLSGFLRCE